MREGTRGHLLSIFCTFWCASLFQIDARSQQTFVVRYKNGEHTIPVTVVLDYKKQTEHVINMSPRAVTKTVTLYDFKQKTIAYKDLTNRECFLGRLTHETLNEETDALTKIQSPVERQPKVLSLDPQRPSLTPTEIRNMAGQKTAVFCGKMNTWLVLPREPHSLQKREVDEIEERTFHRQGYHTVQYSHFGRETRRRYRNPTSRQFSQRRTDASKIPEWMAGSLDTRSENRGQSMESPSFQQQLLNPSLLETVFNGNSLDIHHPESSIINGKEALNLAPTFRPASIAANYNSGKTAPSASLPDDLNEQTEYGLQFPHDPAEIPNQQGEYESRRDSRSKNFQNLKNISMMHEVSENEKTSISENKPFYSALYNPEMVTAKPVADQQNKQNLNFNLSGGHKQNGESISSGHDLNKLHLKASDGQVIRDDANVSSNVLSIPKTGKEPENVENPLHQPPVLQTKEDVHDVFEGFFNLGNSDPSSEHLTYNSPFIPSEGGREHNYADKSLINSYPSVFHTRIDYEKKQQGRENEVITSTTQPILKTNSNSNGARISYFNSVSNSRLKPEISDHLISTPQKAGHSSRSWTVELLQPVTSKYGNTLNEVVDEYFAPENLSFVSAGKKHSNLRSDASNDTILTDISGNITPTNFDRNLQDPTNFFHSGIQDSIASQKIRFQNVLHNYKPDQIIIDVEKIPTQRPPESVSGFQGQVYSPNNNIPPNLSRNIDGSNSEQTSGDTWQGMPIRKTNLSIRKTYHLQPGSINFASRMSQKHRYNGSNLLQNRVHDNNIQELIYPSPHPVYNAHHSYKLDSLPPGVSIHPRHPKAPYADTFIPKTLPSVPQVRTLKLHRHRHHKKKHLLVNSCCRAKGKARGCCGSCCRNKSTHTKPPCCSSARLFKNEQKQKQLLIANTLAPQQARKSAADARSRCQKEKLCRTLYESTRQVMVCRNAKIDGC